MALLTPATLRSNGRAPQGHALLGPWESKQPDFLTRSSPSSLPTEGHVVNQGHPRRASRRPLGRAVQSAGARVPGGQLSPSDFIPRSPSYGRPRPLLSACSVVASPFLPERRGGEKGGSPCG